MVGNGLYAEMRLSWPTSGLKASHGCRWSAGEQLHHACPGSHRRDGLEGRPKELIAAFASGKLGRVQQTSLVHLRRPVRRQILSHPITRDHLDDHRTCPSKCVCSDDIYAARLPILVTNVGQGRRTVVHERQLWSRRPGTPAGARRSFFTGSMDVARHTHSLTVLLCNAAYQHHARSMEYIDLK